jgi:hypothetical protein
LEVGLAVALIGCQGIGRSSSSCTTCTQLSCRGNHCRSALTVQSVSSLQPRLFHEAHRVAPDKSLGMEWRCCVYWSRKLGGDRLGGMSPNMGFVIARFHIYISGEDCAGQLNLQIPDSLVRYYHEKSSSKRLHASRCALTLDLVESSFTRKCLIFPAQGIQQWPFPLLSPSSSFFMISVR